MLGIGTSMNLLSVLVGLGAAWLVAHLLTGSPVWALAPFLAAVTYLLLEGLETALGERLAKAAGDEEAEHLES